jgi:MFS family permease
MEAYSVLCNILRLTTPAAAAVVQGRKKTMMFGGVCFLAGAILLAAAFTWAQLVVGRLVLGLGVGLATMATPFYMNEMTPPQWRGEAGCMKPGARGSGGAVGPEP